MANDLPYKKNPDGTVDFLILTESEVDVAPEGDNVLLYLRGDSLEDPRRGSTFQCLMPPTRARELAKMLADIVARMDHTLS